MNARLPGRRSHRGRPGGRPAAPGRRQRSPGDSGWDRPWVFALVMAVLAALIVSSARVRDGVHAATRSEVPVRYGPSGAVLERLALSFDALIADVYWIRVLQHYGGARRAPGPERDYGRLAPLLDITTTLDPRFAAAYRLGAAFLSEAAPNGPGRPDLGIALLEKGIEAMPDRWQYYLDIGFIHYWWQEDHETAAAWFGRAAEVSGAPWWLRSLEANTLAAGGSRDASRTLWRQMYDSAGAGWIRDEAARRMAQLDAMNDIERLHSAARRFARQTGGPPRSWQALIDAGFIPGIPVDPTGRPYVIDVATGTIGVAADSALFPLPGEPPPPLP